MTIPELKATIAQLRSQGLDTLYLQVTRKSPPRGERIKIAGFGTGYLMNAIQEDDGQWRISCVFKIGPIEKNIRAWEADNQAFHKFKKEMK